MREARGASVHEQRRELLFLLYSSVFSRVLTFDILRSKLYELQAQKKEEEEKAAKGEFKKIEWSHQIRSYVFHPYKMVKDHRTGTETSNVEKVLDGGLDIFIEAELNLV